MKSKEKLLEMFFSALSELQETNNTYLKLYLKHELGLLLLILEDEIDNEYVEQAETLLSKPD